MNYQHAWSNYNAWNMSGEDYEAAILMAYRYWMHLKRKERRKR